MSERDFFHKMVVDLHREVGEVKTEIKGMNGKMDIMMKKIGVRPPKESKFPIKIIVSAGGIAGIIGLFIKYMG